MIVNDVARDLDIRGIRKRRMCLGLFYCDNKTYCPKYCGKKRENSSKMVDKKELTNLPWYVSGFHEGFCHKTLQNILLIGVALLGKDSEFRFKAFIALFSPHSRVEKYRPNNLNELISHKDIIKTSKSCTSLTIILSTA